MTVEQVQGGQRFEALLKGASGMAHDQPLLEHDEWLVAPTLGAVVPGWLLALPRQRVLSFRDWAAMDGCSVQSVLADVRVRLGLEPEEAIWFEHGPAQAGTLVGCGLDHAHLHILIRPQFSFEAFVERSRASAILNWRETSAAESYSLLAGTASYCVAGSGDRAICATDVEATGSQFFRRVVAGLVGYISSWDYRSHAHSQNIDATVAMFKLLESAVRREG